MKLILLLHSAFASILVGAIAPQMQTAVFKGVPDNWATSIDIDPFEKIGQKYYFLKTGSKLSWYAAAHECRRRNANLASIESAEELDALEKYLLRKKLSINFLRIWISGNDFDKEGSFYWLGNGNPIAFARWGTNQPDDEGRNENCLHLILENDRLVINDWFCSQTAEYICEAKTPTTIALTMW